MHFPLSFSEMESCFSRHLTNRTLRWLNNYGKDPPDICRVENSRENSLTIPAPVFFLPETDAGMGKADGKTKSINGISGTKYVDREYIDYDWESRIQIRNTYTCNRLKHLARHNIYNHASLIGKQYT